MPRLRSRCRLFLGLCATSWTKSWLLHLLNAVAGLRSKPGPMFWRTGLCVCVRMWGWSELTDVSMVTLPVLVLLKQLPCCVLPWGGGSSWICAFYLVDSCLDYQLQHMAPNL